MGHLSFNRICKHSSCEKIVLSALWIILVINNKFTFRFVHGLSASKSGNLVKAGSASFPSRRSGRHNVVSTTRRETVVSAKSKNERTIVILYNKPPNVITSHESQDARSTVYEDIQSMGGFLPTSNVDDRNGNEKGNQPVSFEEATGIRSKLHAIGRLDADTTGLLLLTNDGRLVHHVTNPDSKTQEHEYYPGSSNASTTIINKTYQALIMGHHTEESLEPIRRGVDIGKNYVTKPLLGEDDLQVSEHPNHKSTIVSITIDEGKNRQVRKMFHAIGSGVMKLKRTRIGDHLTLDGVDGASNFDIFYLICFVTMLLSIKSQNRWCIPCPISMFGMIFDSYL